jgi:DNA-directed RNA polymerase specialized sigma24 family protein
MDRNQLWRLLVVITVRKAFAVRQRESRQKRPKAFLISDWTDEELTLAKFLSKEPDPGAAAQMAEEWQRLLNLLDDPQLCAVAQGVLEGYTNEELAARDGCCVRTVERRLNVIRSLWSEETQA